MFSDVEKSLQDEGAKLIAKSAKSVLSWTVSKLKKNYDIQNASRHYLERYLGRYGHIKVLGMSQPVLLKEIYTAVQFVSPDSQRAFASKEALQQQFRQSGKRGFYRHQGKRRDGLTVANEIQFLNVLGQPGSGKSTFLKRVGLEAITSSIGSYNELIPVLVELKTFKVHSIDLREIIRNEFVTCGFPSFFSDSALENGKLLVLLDGLDEVPNDKLEEVIQHIKDFVDRYDANRFITSCRTAFYKTWFARFTDVALADFDDNQIRTFIGNWFRSQLDREQNVPYDFWKLLRHPDHVATLELARTPLLLTFLCLVYDRTQNLPPNRSSLYKKAINILLEEWAAEKRVTQTEIYQGLHPDLEILMLQHIAGPAFQEDRIFFTQKELVEEINAFLRRELNAPRHLNGSQVLEAIEVHQGLLVQRAHDVYSFSHLTLQEYLAARYFLETGKMDNIIKAYLFDPRWQEVFLLAAGMTQADDFLWQMASVLQASLEQIGELHALIKWAEVSVRGNADELAAESRTGIQKNEARKSRETPAKKVLTKQDQVRMDAEKRLDRAEQRKADILKSTSIRSEQDLDPMILEARARIESETVGAKEAYLRTEAHRVLAARRAAAFAIGVDLLSEMDVNSAFEVARSLGLQMDIRHARALTRVRKITRELRSEQPAESDLQGICTRSIELVRELGMLGFFQSEMLEAAETSLQSIAKSISMEEVPSTRKIDSYEKIILAILHGIHGDLKPFLWSGNTLKELERCLGATLLVIQCKNAALSISISKWEHVLGTLLSVNDAV